MDTFTHIKEVNKNKHLVLDATDDSKEKITKYEKFGVTSEIRSITKNSDDYDEKYMKIKFNSDDELPLNKMIEILSMSIFARAIFIVNKKYYSQVFLEECLYKL